MTQPTEPQNEAMKSPLEGIKHQTLDELFSRDPLTLSDSDLTEIVKNLRAQREKWAVEEQQTQTKSRPKKSPPTQQELQDLANTLGI